MRVGDVPTFERHVADMAQAAKVVEEAVAALTWDYNTDDCHTCDDWEEER